MCAAYPSSCMHCRARSLAAIFAAHYVCVCVCVSVHTDLRTTEVGSYCVADGRPTDAGFAEFHAYVYSEEVLSGGSGYVYMLRQGSMGNFHAARGAV